MRGCNVFLENKHMQTCSPLHCSTADDWLHGSLIRGCDISSYSLMRGCHVFLENKYAHPHAAAQQVNGSMNIWLEGVIYHPILWWEGVMHPWETNTCKHAHPCAAAQQVNGSMNIWLESIIYHPILWWECGMYLWETNTHKHAHPCAVAQQMKGSGWYLIRGHNISSYSLMRVCDVSLGTNTCKHAHSCTTAQQVKGSMGMWLEGIIYHLFSDEKMGMHGMTLWHRVIHTTVKDGNHRVW